MFPLYQKKMALYIGCDAITHLSSSSSSEVQRVKLSLMSCMMVVASLYWSSSIWSISAIASSKACLASWQALLGSFLTSQWKTEQLRARPSLMGWVVLRSFSALSVAAVQATLALSPAFLFSAPLVYSEMYLQQSPFILQQNTVASAFEAFEALGRSEESMRLRISLQYLLSSPSILALQLLRRPMFLEPFCSSFFSMEERALQAVLRDPMVFLQATERRFLSSTVRSAFKATTLFMASNMSSNLSVCSVILAMQRCSSREFAVIFVVIQIKYKTSTKFQILKYSQFSAKKSPCFFILLPKINTLIPPLQRALCNVQRILISPKYDLIVELISVDLGEAKLFSVLISNAWMTLQLFNKIFLVNIFFVVKSSLLVSLNKIAILIILKDKPMMNHYYNSYYNMASKLMRLACLFLLLTLICAQQVCLKQQCAKELAACNDQCQSTMGKCMFTCTLSSLGCLQKCLGDNAIAQNLLECSFNKCINL